MFEAAGERFAGRAAYPVAELHAPISRMRVGGPLDTFTREILTTRRPVLIRNPRTDSGSAQGRLQSFGVRTILGVPLMDGDAVIGIVFLDNADVPHPYAPEHLELAAAIGRVAGTAVAQRNDGARMRAQLDTRRDPAPRRVRLQQRRPRPRRGRCRRPRR